MIGILNILIRHQKKISYSPLKMVLSTIPSTQKSQISGVFHLNAFYFMKNTPNLMGNNQLIFN